jgi:hypothetical protein
VANQLLKNRSNISKRRLVRSARRLSRCLLPQARATPRGRSAWRIFLQRSTFRSSNTTRTTRRGRARPLDVSNGHITPVRYAAMAHAGYFPIAECLTLRKFGTRLQGHPERTKLPGVETTSGPLGSGLGQAAGYAYGARMDSKKFRVYAFMSRWRAGCRQHLGGGDVCWQ